MNSQASRRVRDTRRAERKRERDPPIRHELQCQQLRASAALDEQRRGIFNEAANTKCASFGPSTAAASTWRCRVTTTTTTTHVADKPFSLQNCVVAKKFTEQLSQNERKSTSLAEGNLCEKINADVMTPTEAREDLEKSCAWPEGRGPQGMCTTGGGGPRVPNLCVRAPFDFWCGTRRGGKAKSRPARVPTSFVALYLH